MVLHSKWKENVGVKVLSNGLLTMRNHRNRKKGERRFSFGMFFGSLFAFVSLRKLTSDVPRWCVWLMSVEAWDFIVRDSEMVQISEQTKVSFNLGYLKSPCTCLIRSIIFLRGN